MKYDFHKKPFPFERSVEEALHRAEQSRESLPHVVQVWAEEWDIVILADEIYKLRKLLREQNGTSNI